MFLCILFLDKADSVAAKLQCRLTDANYVVETMRYGGADGDILKCQAWWLYEGVGSAEGCDVVIRCLCIYIGSEDCG